MDYTATYSPEDNKLRLYVTERLSEEIYAKIKKLGFRWAPRQELFFAPKWTPQAEDFLIELAGEITPELTSMADRAEERQERFLGYSEQRLVDSNIYFQTAKEITQQFANGQPILAGHHSQRKALKAKARAENAIDKSVKAESTASYWLRRADCAINHANQKNNSRTRQNRIKSLLADMRDFQRTIHKMTHRIRLWDAVSDRETALRAATFYNYSLSGTWQKLRTNTLTWEKAKQDNINLAQRYLEPDSYTRRWIEHLLNRLGYEQGQLGPVSEFQDNLTPTILQVFARSHGTEKPKVTKNTDNDEITFRLESPSPLPRHLGQEQILNKTETEWKQLMQALGYEVPAPRPAKPPILNFRAPEGSLSYANPYHPNEIISLQQVEVTKSQYASVHFHYRGVKLSVCGRYRFKVASRIQLTGDRSDNGFGYVAVFLADAKEHTPPEPPQGSDFDA